MSSRSHALPLEPRSPLSLLMPVASPRHASSSSNSAAASAAGVRIQARAPPPFALHVHVGAVFVHRQTVGGGDQNFKWLARVVCDALARECKMAPNVFVPVNICDAVWGQDALSCLHCTIHNFRASCSAT
jgi:hypothetical protein